MKPNNTFKTELYTIGDFFRKYHNGIMFSTEFTIDEIKKDIADLTTAVQTITESLE